jgi:hypothetical protein
MKMVKSLLLGTAAGLVAMSGAQAADLPVKAKPVQYVKICSLYGAGFYYIPGTDTCIKIGGFVRTEMNFNAGGSFSFLNGNLDDPNRNDVLWRSRAVVTFDVRSQTEYGTLRSYMAGGYQWDNGAGSGVNASPAGALNNSLNIYRGFIQWAGFTAGRSKSFFDVFDTTVKQCLTFIALFFFHTLAWAQDKGFKVDVDINSKRQPAPVAWYASPWAWVIGGAVFIIVLVAILSGNRNKGN